jgi:hypothetical protein
VASAHGPASSGCPAGRWCSTSRAGTGDLCRELAAAGYRPVGVRLLPRDADGLLRTDAPFVEADILRLPV